MLSPAIGRAFRDPSDVVALASAMIATHLRLTAPCLGSCTACQRAIGVLGTMWQQAGSRRRFVSFTAQSQA
jgi:hypothetical protein